MVQRLEDVLAQQPRVERLRHQEVGTTAPEVARNAQASGQAGEEADAAAQAGEDWARNMK